MLLPVLLGGMAACSDPAFIPYQPPTLERPRPGPPKEPELQIGRVGCIPLAQEDGGRIWSYCRSDGFMWSDDEGASWNGDGAKLEVRPRLIDFRPGRPSVMLADDRSIWTSADGRSNWKRHSLAPAGDELEFQQIFWDEKRDRILLWTNKKLFASPGVANNPQTPWRAVAAIDFGRAVRSKDGLLIMTSGGELLRLVLQQDSAEEVAAISEFGYRPTEWRAARITGSDAAGWFFLGREGRVAHYRPDRKETKLFTIPLDTEPSQIIWDGVRQRLMVIHTHESIWTDTRVLVQGANGWRVLPYEPKAATVPLPEQIYLRALGKQGDVLLLGTNGARLRVAVDKVTVLSRGLDTGRRLEGGLVSADGARIALAGWDGLVAMSLDHGRSWDTKMPLTRTNLSGLAGDAGLRNLWITDGLRLASYSDASGWKEIPNPQEKNIDRLFFEERTQLLWATGNDGILRFDPARRDWLAIHTVTAKEIRRLIFIPGTSLALAHIGKELYLRESEGAFQLLQTPLTGLPRIYADSKLDIDAIEVAMVEGRWVLWALAGFTDIPSGMPKKLVMRSDNLKSWRHVFPAEKDLPGVSGQMNLAVVPDTDVLLVSDGNGINKISLDGGVSWDVALRGNFSRNALHSSGTTSQGRLLLYGTAVNHDIGQEEKTEGRFGFLGNGKKTRSHLMAYRLTAPPSNSSNTLELRFSPGDVCKVEGLKIALLYRLSGESVYRPLNAQVEGPRPEGRVRLNFSLDGLGLQSRNRFDLRVVAACTDGLLADTSHDLGGFQIGTLSERVPGGSNTLIVAFVLLFFPAVGVLAYWFRPILLLHARNLAWNAIGDMLPTQFAWIPKVLVGVLLVPTLSLRPRVMRAWAEQNRQAFHDAVERNPTARAANAYIPCPAVVVLAGKETVLDRPVRRDVLGLLESTPQVIDIVGQGGVGKTRFGLEVLRWLAGSSPQARDVPVAAPIWLDEPIENLAATLDQHIRLAAGKVVDEKLRNALIESGHILVVLDRFSEQSAATQAQLCRLWKDMRAGFLLVTRRDVITPLDGAARRVTIKPLPLDQYTLPIFLAAYLRAVDDTHVLSGESEPAEIAASLGRTIQSVRTGVGMQAVAITPLLVTMFARTALEQRKSGGDLGRLPVTLPDVFFQYVERLDGANVNGVPLEPLQVRWALQLLAQVCLTHRSFLPRSFHRDEALAQLGSRFTEAASGNVLQRLHTSGVLQVETVATTQLLRFQLDPLAEFFGLYARAHRCGRSARAWCMLRARLARVGERSDALMATLAMIHIAYADKLQWAEQDWTTTTGSVGKTR